MSGDDFLYDRSEREQPRPAGRLRARIVAWLWPALEPLIMAAVGAVIAEALAPIRPPEPPPAPQHNVRYFR